MSAESVLDSGSNCATSRVSLNSQTPRDSFLRDGIDGPIIALYGASHQWLARHRRRGCFNVPRDLPPQALFAVSTWDFRLPELVGFEFRLIAFASAFSNAT